MINQIKNYINLFVTWLQVEMGKNPEQTFKLEVNKMSLEAIKKDDTITITIKGVK